MKITSVNNELVKDVAKLLKSKHREDSGLFLIEGEKGVTEAINAKLEIKYIFVEEGNTKYTGDNVVETTGAVLGKISDAKSAPKVIAVAKQIKTDIQSFKDMQRVILLENIKDAGNLGTILRTAAAFKIDGIVLYGDTVDLYNPKCVRSAVGNLWKLQIVKLDDFNTLEKTFKDFDKIATLPKNENVIELSNYTPKDKTLIMFGSEAEGLSKGLKDFATQNITIEMSSEVESLNLSISAGIIMYKIMNH